MAEKRAIPAKLRQFVRDRAAGRCDYCLLHDDDMLLPHEVDHIVAEQHGGLTHPDNLAYACYYCNHFKGPNLASVDDQTDKVILLFHPRKQQWRRHFRLNGPRIEPISSCGRATAALLRFNSQSRIDERLRLIEIGHYPR